MYTITYVKYINLVSISAKLRTSKSDTNELHSNIFCSTTSNCPAPRPCPDQVEQDVGPSTSTVTNADVEDDEVSATRKCKTKSEIAREEQFNKLLKIAEQEDHPVDLALSAIGKQMIWTLTADEQDELLEDICCVSDKYFRERRK